MAGVENLVLEDNKCKVIFSLALNFDLCRTLWKVNHKTSLKPSEVIFCTWPDNDQSLSYAKFLSNCG
jgi:hypothetical protein